MGATSAEPGTEAGWIVIRAAVRSARNRLGSGLLSAYAIGSLAHGGFAAAVSDVDLALLTDQRPDRDTGAVTAAVAADVRDAGHALAERLSIFHVPWRAFSDPPPGARCAPIDRYDLFHHGILVYGTDLRGTYATAPTAQEVRRHAVDSALGRVTPEQLTADLRQLGDDGVSVHDATKIVLWPVRLQHVCDTGRATGNLAAVEHYLRLTDARHRSLVRDALAWRDVAAIPDPGSALRRIGDEIHDLHVEVFTRLSRQPTVPRRDELGQRAEQLGGSRAPS